MNAGVAVSNSRADDAVRLTYNWLNGVMAINDLNVTDGANPASEVGFQERAAGKVNDNRGRVGKFTRPIELMPPDPYGHT
ncbi:hypothetical protein A4G30_02285 [Mycobacterium kansasii]|uniref:Uncharacterized protein n=1 Tax=Mycobacterium kansasii TaxID=1768 RepID=A0A1V3WZ84_MYCKA|nr:hypothetical protein A4G30_02285 [Mycobacterium kansasii]OOK72363.1 hypothetical protein BZL30_5962 [Mycobacterium kansasii]POX69558.1 hypothetical protein C3471_26500 [Mycobacterium kansasii]POX70068.1 hypothetical protein C3475_26630 [Mycobacterium kansasii]POX92722.1 hypothetical protein C3473_20010 [Mycobacterium kansasii]